ncbi:VCBS domain-containing protein, partial [Aliarcobacter butzleri]
NATDTAGGTDTKTVTFIITGTNDAPIFGTIETTNPITEAPTAGTTNPNAGVEVFNNGFLRFGNGSIDSVNASTGMLEQPWYYKDGTWYKLTFSSYQLNMAIAADYNSGSSKTDVDWNLEGTVNLTPTFTNTRVDNSGFNASTGTGTIVWTGEINVGTARLEVTNVYTLNADSKFVKANTYIKNIGTTSTENLRFWVGTRDDYVAGTDSPAKQKGNIVDGEFTMISSQNEQAKAIKVYTGTGANATAVLFYSTNDNVNTVIAPNYGWSTSNGYSPGIDPLNSVINQTYDDGGYAMFTNLNNVEVGKTVMFDWYYAAGAVSELSDITSSLESETSKNLQESSTSLILSSDYTITDLDITDEVNVDVTSVLVTPPNGLTIPTNYTNDILKNMLSITSNPVISSGDTTGTVSWSFNSGSDYTFNFLGAGQTLSLVYTLTATDNEGSTATTTVTILIDGTNDAPMITVDSEDLDQANLTESNSTLITSGTLSIIDPDITDN